MRVRYRIPFSRKIIVPDHWEIPIQGGTCHLVEEGGAVKYIEAVVRERSVSEGPHIVGGENEGDIPTIVVNDQNLSLVQFQLEDAMAFLQSQFNVGLDWNEVEAFYEAESEEEEDQIAISDIKIGRKFPTAVLPFNLFAGAIICAEKERGPSFEATLVASGREAMFQKRYIDSFRYSFLLIESRFGDGKFKSIELKRSLKKDVEFMNAAQQALQNFKLHPGAPPSDTSRLLNAGRNVDALIDHLVDKRGIYFHGNLRRPDAWRAEQQSEAQDLAAISAEIVLAICLGVASSMHSPSVAQRFNEYAIRAGAQIVYQIDFTFRMPEETFTRQHRLNVTANGTKPTGDSIIEVIKLFISHFEDYAPMGTLETAVCVIQHTGKKVFEMSFPQDSQASE
jgi:hypothetical protein